MRRLTMLLAVLGMLLPMGAAAQPDSSNVIEDTLDWRGYYPLEVGNVWEYEISYRHSWEVDYQRREITGDTLIEGVRYFRHRTRSYEPDGTPSDSLTKEWDYTDFVRYDTTYRAVVAVPADSTRRQRWPFSPFYYPQADAWEEERGICALDAAFGAVESPTCGSDTLLTSVGGKYLDGYFIGRYRIRSLKVFPISSAEEIVLLNGFGQDLGRLRYSRVGGEEYGESFLTKTSNERSPAPPEEQLRLLSIYPNPFRDRFKLRFAVRSPRHVRVDVFDALGRRVTTLANGRFATGQHRLRFEAEGLPSGVYVIRATMQLADGEARGFTRKMTLVR